jgi:hypothetical protein
MERLAPGHHGYPGTSNLIRVEAPGGPHVPPDRGRDGETVSPSPSIRLADLGRNPIVLVIEVSLVLHFRRLLGRLVSVQSRRRRLDTRFVAASLHQDGQSDAGQLVSKRDR